MCMIRLSVGMEEYPVNAFLRGYRYMSSKTLRILLQRSFSTNLQLSYWKRCYLCSLRTVLSSKRAFHSSMMSIWPVWSDGKIGPGWKEHTASSSVQILGGCSGPIQGIYWLMPYLQWVDDKCLIWKHNPVSWDAWGGTGTESGQRWCRPIGCETLYHSAKCWGDQDKDRRASTFLDQFRRYINVTYSLYHLCWYHDSLIGLFFSIRLPSVPPGGEKFNRGAHTNL